MVVYLPVFKCEKTWKESAYFATNKENTPSRDPSVSNITLAIKQNENLSCHFYSIAFQMIICFDETLQKATMYINVRFNAL